MKNTYINLIGAIITQAINDLKLSDKTAENRKNKRSAEQFFTKGGGLDYYCSFCDIDADYIRGWVAKRHTSRRQKHGLSKA